MDLTQYIHRVGRTARAGKKGKAISLAGEGDRKVLKKVIKSASSKIQERVIPPEAIIAASEKILQMEEDIAEILKEEQLEREVQDSSSLYC
jgi:ATP-dependent RNA helicase DDX27